MGDKLNALLCACGHNLRLMLSKMRLEGRPQLIFVLLRWRWSWLVGLGGGSEDAGVRPRRDMLMA